MINKYIKKPFDPKITIVTETVIGPNIDPMPSNLFIVELADINSSCWRKSLV